jgi:tRNA (cytidine/uridine-2'-O-)-methyltransferase
MVEPYALPNVATARALAPAMKRKSRREGSAALIAVTVPILVRLAGQPDRAASPPPEGPYGGRSVSSDLGKIRSDAIRRRLLAPLPGECKVGIDRTRRPAFRGVAGPHFAMRIALYEPDIPQNTGTILRLCACLGVAADIIEPAGFPTSDRAFRRAGMDYLDAVALRRHASWPDFESWRRGERYRVVLFTTAASLSYLDHSYREDDVLLFGRESAGVPAQVHAAADARVVIPMRPGLRSLNVALAAAMAVGEALRQTGGTG